MTKFQNPSFSSPANSNAYRDNYDKVFAKPCKWHDGDHDPYCDRPRFPGREYCAYHLEKMGIEPEKPETD